MYANTSLSTYALGYHRSFSLLVILSQLKGVSDRLVVAKLGRWVPRIYKFGDEQRGLLNFARSVAMMISSAENDWNTPQLRFVVLKRLQGPF